MAAVRFGFKHSVLKRNWLTASDIIKEVSKMREMQEKCVSDLAESLAFSLDEQIRKSLSEVDN